MAKIKRVTEYPELTTEVIVSSEATIALVTATIDGEQFLWEGTAKRTPSDKYDREIGIKLALSRALERAYRQLARQASGKVKCYDDNTTRPKIPNKTIHRIPARKAAATKLKPVAKVKKSTT